MIKIIFLDIDGVLTSANSNWKLDPVLFARLKIILDKTDANLVISSSWRGDDKESTIRNLTDTTHPLIGDNPFPFIDKIIGVTPRCNAWMRGQEIRAWFDRHKTLGKIDDIRWIAIDDEEDFFADQSDNVVYTKSSTGIQDIDVELAIKMLNS